MPLQTVNNGDSGAVARAKINAAIDAINAMSTTTTTSTSTTASPTTTSSTTSTSTTTTPTTTTSSTTSSTSTTTSANYNYVINNCAGGSSYTITTSTNLSLVGVYKFFAVGAPYDTNACWTITPSAMGGTFSTMMTSYGDCSACGGTTTTTTSTSSTTMPTSTSSTSTTTFPTSTTSSSTTTFPTSTTSSTSTTTMP
jgi:hypothetical protein